MSRGGNKRTTRSARRFVLAALLAVLALGAWGAYAVLAASTPPPAPTITASPSTPSNSTNATFSYTEDTSVTLTRFECSKDGAAFATCGTARPSSISYSGLSQGSHTFQVRAVSGNGANNTSAATSFTWTVDTQAPTVLSLQRADANPSNSNPLHWTLSFSEPVRNVAPGDFRFTLTKIGGTAPTVTAVTPAGSAPSATWTVTVSTAGTTGATDGQIELDLITAGSPAIQDAAGNVLAAGLPKKGEPYNFDTTPPNAPTISGGPSSPTNQTSASFNFDSGGATAFLCQIDNGGFTPCTKPKAYTGLAAGQHTFQVEARDALGNTSAASSFTWTIDLTPPTVVSMVATDPQPTSAASIHWTVTFSESVGGVAVDGKNFSLAFSGFMSAPKVTGVTASGITGTTYIVTANTDGFTTTNLATEQLVLSSAGAIADQAGNPLAGVPVSGQTYSVDKLAPQVNSINRATASPTNAGTVSWTVTFSENVTGVDATDFALVASGSVNGAGGIGVSGSGSVYTVSANSGSGDGTLGLNLNDNDSILDTAGNALGGAGTGTAGGAGAGNGSFVGQVYSINKTRPTIVSFVKASTTTPTAATSVVWNLTFSEPVTGLTGSNFALTQSGMNPVATIANVVGTGTSWTVTASTGSNNTPSGSGTVELRLTSTAGIVDVAGNTLNAIPPVSGGTYTIDHLGPPVSFTQTPPDPNSTATSNFTWSSSPAAPDFDHYECSTENGPFSTTVESQGGTPQPCASPLSYVVATTSNGQHQFAVRAVDHLGNYTQISYSWKVAAGTPAQFVIHGSVSNVLIGVAKAVPLTIDNPNSVPIYVSQLSFTVSMNSGSGSCSASNFSVGAWTAATSADEFQVPANAVGYVVPAAKLPTIQLVDLPASNQDACKNKTFSLKFSGSAHS